MILTDDDQCLVRVVNTITPSEKATILGDATAMRAVIDGSGTLPPTTCWITFYLRGEFCGGIANVQVLPNNYQPEWHLFYLSTAPIRASRIFCELAYMCALFHRWQPYTVIRATPELQYMHNFMLRMGCHRIPHHGRYFYFVDAAWKPKKLKKVIVHLD